MKLKLVRGLLVCASAVVVMLSVTASPAQTAVPTKEELLLRWTSPTATSFAQWNTNRQDQSAWRRYDFDWSTDYCSVSPDEPLGFDFRMACWRHDFGYRNYSDIGQFPANKARLDNAFYYDLSTKCASYVRRSKASCDALALTYYEAVKIFGAPGGAGQTTAGQTTADQATENETADNRTADNRTAATRSTAEQIEQSTHRGPTRSQRW